MTFIVLEYKINICVILIFVNLYLGRCVKEYLHQNIFILVKYCQKMKYDKFLACVISSSLQATLTYY